MGAVEVRGSPGIAEAVRVVTGKEEADVALLVQGVAPCVAGAEREVFGEALFNVRFECVVG